MLCYAARDENTGSNNYVSTYTLTRLGRGIWSDSDQPQASLLLCIKAAGRAKVRQEWLVYDQNYPAQCSSRN